MNANDFPLLIRTRAAEAGRMARIKRPAPTPTAHSDVFITKLNATGTGLVYSTYLGGNGAENGIAIAVDAAGNAYVTGATNSSDFPTRNALQTTLRNPFDNAFVAKLKADGSALLLAPRVPRNRRFALKPA